MNAEHAIVLFDGHCLLCNRSVKFIIRNDKNSYFKFATLQSEIAKSLIGGKTIPIHKSVIVIENDRIYDRSSAVLRIIRKLDGLWFFFYFFIIIPKPLRNMVYSLIRKNRYKWFGKTVDCMIPSPEESDRFIRY